VDAVASGTGRLVLLAGEPGAGKTRLAQEITVHLRDQGFRIAAGRCYEPEQTVPYYPFLDALATVYAAIPPGLQRDLAHRFPYLGILLPDHLPLPGPSGGDEQNEQRVLRAVTSFLEVTSAAHPLALLLDDLHWS